MRISDWSSDVCSSDLRLIETVPSAVAQAATDSAVARRPLTDVATYRQALRERLNPTTAVLASTHELARSRSTRMIFAEAEEDTVLRAAIAFHEGGYGTPILVDQNERVRESLQGLECDPADRKSTRLNSSH